MQIQQIRTLQDQLQGANATQQTETKTSQIEKTNSYFMIDESQQTIEEALTTADVSQKAKSMTESKTGNHAEYVAGVMNPEIVKTANEQGMDVEEEEPDVMLTVVDKIQIQMVEGGNESVMATADLSAEQLKELSVNHATAYEMASHLETPSKEALAYLVENQLEPTIGNFYQAQTITSHTEGKRETLQIDVESLKEPIQQKLQEFGVAVTDETMNRAIFMLQEGIGLTKENYNYLQQIESISFPLTENQIMSAIQGATMFGRMPVQGMVLEGYTWQERAVKAEEVINHTTDEQLVALIESGNPITIENLSFLQQQESGKVDTGDNRQGLSKEQMLKLTTARKSLEQVRLQMSAEANLSLLRRGIHIETEPMEQLIQELTKQEEELSEKIYHQSHEAGEAAPRDQFIKTTEIISDFKVAPAYLLESISFKDTLTEVDKTLENAKEEYAKANVAYETMMTEVRSDLGDSITKAFRNVDVILEDLNLEANAENQRAVRILAYNRTEITVENILKMKDKDEQLQSLFSNLTPKVVLGMIREGYNPLDVSLEELNQKAIQIKEQQDPLGADSYSKFLLQLEQQGEISKQERDSYIGIYRLLRQVEKTDGAAVGAVVLSGEKMTMRNLMTQVRNQRAGKIDLVADQQTRESDQTMVADLSITQQIEKSYQTSCLNNALEQLTPDKLSQLKEDPWQMSPEELLEALREGGMSQGEESPEAEQEVRDVKKAYQILDSQKQVEQFIEQTELPKNAETILAVADFLGNRNQLYRSLYKREQRVKEQIAEIKTQLWEDFSENIKTPEEMAKAQEALADAAESVMEGMMESEEVTELDVRQMKLEHMQLGILAEMAKKEEYAVPVLVSDEMGCVSLKIVRGKDEKGKVSIMTQMEHLGKIAAEFSITNQGIKGYVVSDREETTTRLSMLDKQLQEALTRELGMDATEYHSSYVTGNERSFNQYYHAGSSEGHETEVQTKQLYAMARLFIKSLTQL